MTTKEEPMPEFLTTAEVAQTCRVTTTTVRRWAADGVLRAKLSPSGRRLFVAADVLSLIVDEL